MRPKYKAFISYSHSADKTLAPKIQKELRLLGRPLFKKEAFTIFRDQTNLSVNPDLWRYIQNALSNSEFFILLASPSAAKSKWVLKEVSYWLQNKSLDSLIILITEGNLKWDDDAQDFDWNKSNCLPKILAGRYSSEPLYIDLRELKNLENKSFNRKLLVKVIEPVSAKLHHKSVDQLFGDITRIHRKRITIRNLAITALALLLAISSILGYLSHQNSKAGELVIEANRFAEENPSKAMALYIKALNIKKDERMVTNAERFNAKNIFYVDSIGPLRGNVNDLFFSQDYRRMAVVYTDNTVEFWDLVNKSSTDLIPIDGMCHNILFSPTQKEFLISHKFDEIITIKDSSIFRNLIDKTSNISSFTNAPQKKINSKALKFSDYDDVVEINDSAKNIHAKLIGHNSYINEVNLSPLNNLLITASVDRSIKLWTVDGNNLYTLKGHGYDVSKARFIENGNKIISVADYEKYAKIWELKGVFIKNIPLSPIDSLLVKDDMVDVMVSGFFEGDSVVYSANYNGDTTPSSTEYYIDIQKISGEHLSRINEILIEPYAERAVSYVKRINGVLAVKENSANIWNMKGEELFSYPHSEVIFAIASPDESHILTIGTDSIKLFDLESSELLASTDLNQPKYENLFIEPHTARFEKGGKYFYLGDYGKITKWEKDDLRITTSIPTLPEAEVVSMDISTISNEILVATADHGILRINLSDNSIKQFANHTIMNNAVKYSPNGQQYLTSGTNGQLKLWSISDQLLREFYTGSVLWSVDFSHDAKYIICGARNGAQIWRGIDPL